jgi:hypothetical protein
MKPGTVVKMSEELKLAFIANDCADHVQEFGDCTGTVIGPMQPGWEEVDVRWHPSELKYGYHPKHLVVVGQWDGSLSR